jgi:hypothetical protein
MNMFPHYLAEAAPDAMISGNWIIGVIGALASAGALILGKYQGRKEAQESSVTLKKPVPTVVTRSEALFANKPDLDDHVGWTRNEFTRVWSQFGCERTMHNEELTKIHDRINQQSLATSNLRGSVEQIDKNVSQLLTLALNSKPAK